MAGFIIAVFFSPNNTIMPCHSDVEIPLFNHESDETRTDVGSWTLRLDHSPPN